VKKRKFDTPRGSPASPAQPTAATVLKVEGISFSVPQRKKFNLVFTTAGLNAVTTTGEVEFGVLYDDIGIPLSSPPLSRGNVWANGDGIRVRLLPPRPG